MYESFKRLIKNFTEKLESTDFKEKEVRQLLISRINYYDSCLNHIIKEIPNKWDGKSAFSREYIYYFTKILNIPLIFEFRPDSEAYSKYGKTVVGFGIYNKDLEKELLSNLISNPPIATNGNIKIEIVDKNSYLQDVISQLESEGIETIDIYRI